MCDVCNFEEIDTEMLNGKNKRVSPTQLHQAKGNISQLNLCNFHDIEFFLLGERRFIKKYPKLLRKLGLHEEELVLNLDKLI